MVDVLCFRLPLLFLAAVLALFGVGDVLAQDYAACFDVNETLAMCPDRQAAYEQIIAHAEHKIATGSACQSGGTTLGAPIHGNSVGYDFYRIEGVGGNTICRNYFASSRRRYVASSECPVGTIWNDRPGQHRCMNACSSRPTLTFSSPHQIPNGSVGCSDGCEWMSYSNGDGTFTRNYLGDASTYHCSVVPNTCMSSQYMNFMLGMCVPLQEQCAGNEVKDPHSGECRPGCPVGMVAGPDGACEQERDNCPAGMIRSPSGSCLPGDGQCAVGEARKPDGTCGRDSDGDGDADDDWESGDETTFAGGDSCDSPPACNGDPIQCGQARIQWRIDCNTRHDNRISGGSCDAVPICTGQNCDAMEYAQLLMQWRASCRTVAQTGEGPDLSVGGMSQDAGEGETEADLSAVTDTDFSVNDIDQSGFGGGGGTCPAIASTGGGVAVSGFLSTLAHPPALWCNAIDMFRYIFWLLAAIGCAYWLARGGN